MLLTVNDLRFHRKDELIAQLILPSRTLFSMPSFYTEIEINASRSLVWSALVCKQDWLRWNTFLYDLAPDRPFIKGQTTLLSMRRVGGDEETELQARVSLVQPNVCLKWSYSAPGFQSVHVFELQEIGIDRTKYTHQEKIAGVLSRVFIPFIRRDEQQGMKRMAWELKQYAEGKGRDR